MKRKMGKGKVKGTVLFTVVTVMLVMVVLLMTTLTLTTSAKRRSYYTYFESQAQYAANAAIDAVTFSAYNDANFHDWVTNNVTGTGNGQTGEIHVQFNGSQIQFTDTANPDTNNTVVCRIEKINPDVVWDEATQALHSRDMWRITATASVGNGRNVSTYSVSQYLYENFQIPAQSLPVEALNNGRFTVRDVITNPGQSAQPTPLYSSPAMLSFGNTGFTNNCMTLGPCYNNLATIPLGMFRRSDDNTTTYYESIDDVMKYRGFGYSDPNNNWQWHEITKDEAEPYNLFVTNQNMKSVGNVIIVNNMYMRVLMTCEFQSPREGAVIWGDLNGDNQGIHFISNVKSVNNGNFRENSNYVYVDGIVQIKTGAGKVIVGEQPATENAKSYPINLYCGGIKSNNTGCSVSVSGDVYMYNPDVDSVWKKGDGSTPLTKFTQAQVTKVASVTNYMKDGGGNIVCNNKSLTLDGGNGTFTVAGDIIMTQSDSRLNLNGNVTVTGDIISAGEVNLNGATVGGTVYTGANAWAQANAGYYPNTYTTSQSRNNRKFDYSLMPYISRLDELFETYYRWDLAEADENSARSYLGSDPYILESKAAGHGDNSQHPWSVKEFKYDDGTSSWVPFTTSSSGYWMIPTHTYCQPSQAIGNLVASANGTNYNFTTYAGFIGQTTLPDYSETATENIKAVAHSANGTLDSTISLNGYYVVKQSCEIDTTNYTKIFIDPSALNSSQELKIVLKGNCGNGSLLDVVVNNTAGYTRGYGNPDPYATPPQGSNDPARYINNAQVRIFLKEGFGHKNATLKMRTTGILKQWADKNLCVVQQPSYPGDAGWSSLTGGLKYAYELVPNFVIYGESGKTYHFDESNQISLNADVATPLCKFQFGTMTGQSPEEGPQTITYYETVNSSPSVGSCSLWLVGSFMADEIDMNDRNSLTAYIGSMGMGTDTPPSRPVEIFGGDDSEGNGENRNQNFSNRNRGAA